MERDELIRLVIRIQSFDGTEKELDALVDTFLHNVPDPSALDYLYGKKYEQLNAEQIVDKALSYKPFYL
jgi:hypothetical protein